ncbi:energy-coupling factor transporter transmembrane component T family protein [Alkalicoccus urumqiensis]|uniref:Energy-coupling factor transporter transmembrane protein EcfT n=1 Tax=Alkalicoccus urumqiensis TaxID=1548213 RepID=A0A2P6MIY4_ALKUR|nr:energy-coupling factor transporter transmembrane component T [Alkalicoccus urumqiensis]PRO66237.1 hypothetical protein C6I21_05385 [Alkalicoccus urumqiensis]
MLQQLNPSVKAGAVLVPSILLSFSYDVFTPLVFLFLLLVFTWTWSGMPKKKWLMLFSPFFIGAAGFAWMTMLYAGDGYQSGEVLFSVWHFEVTEGGMEAGISLGLRSLCFIALSLLFVLTTDVTQMMHSFMQQLKLPPKLVYGIMAGFRFLPLFRHEYTVIRQAHRVRGVEAERTVSGRLRHFRRFAVPMLAGAVRRAERTALAMTAKGFTGDKNRTWYKRERVEAKDWVFAASLNGALLLVLAASWYFGYLSIFHWDAGRSQ